MFVVIAEVPVLPSQKSPWQLRRIPPRDLDDPDVEGVPA